MLQLCDQEQPEEVHLGTQLCLRRLAFASTSPGNSEPLVGQMDQADTECQRAEAQQKLADSQNDPNNETCIIVRKLRGAVIQADHSKWELNTI